jgi:nitrilase
MDAPHTLKAAVVQAESVIFNRQGCIDKAAHFVHEAASDGAGLVLFPEAFIPGYPRGLSFGTVVGSRSNLGRCLWEMYWSEAVTIPGPEMTALGELAREAGVYLVMGIIEKDSAGSQATLYCTIVYFGPDGRYLGKHRKLKPTAAERLIWGEGDGSTLTVIDTEHGRMGGLICWENYMPLARMAMYSKGVDIYLAPTADARDSWHATMQHIALEGRCYVLGCNQYFRKSAYGSDFIGLAELEQEPEEMCRGGSTIISPLGKVLAGPLYGEEGILTAVLDLSEITRSRFDFDVVGHYNRPDVFQLIVNEKPGDPVIAR